MKPDVKDEGLALSESEISAAMRYIGRRGGLVTSAAKTAAARKNGRRGGRPPTMTGGRKRTKRTGRKSRRKAA